MIGVPDVLAHTVREFFQEDVAIGLIEHSHVLYRRKGNALTDYRHVHRFSAQLLDGENHRGTRLAAHAVAALGAGETTGGNPVNGHYLVSATDSGLGCGGTLVRLVDEHVAVHIRLVDNGTYTAIGIGEHHLEVFLLFLGDIQRVRIQGRKHGVYGRTLDATHLQGIYIGAVELLEDGVIHLHPLGHIKTFGLGRCRRDRGKKEGRQGQKYQGTFHFHRLICANHLQRRCQCTKIQK